MQSCPAKPDQIAEVSLYHSQDDILEAENISSENPCFYRNTIKSKAFVYSSSQILRNLLSCIFTGQLQIFYPPFSQDIVRAIISPSASEDSLGYPKEVKNLTQDLWWHNVSSYLSAQLWLNFSIKRDGIMNWQGKEKVSLPPDLLALFAKSMTLRSFPWTSPRIKYRRTHLCATLNSWRE